MNQTQEYRDRFLGIEPREDIAKTIREIGQDVDEVCLRFGDKGCYHVFTRMDVTRLANTLWVLNLKSWEVVDVQRRSTPAMISQLNIHLQLNCCHQTNIDAEIIDMLVKSLE